MWILCGLTTISLSSNTGKHGFSSHQPSLEWWKSSPGRHTEPMHEVRARRLIQKSWEHNNPRCFNMLKLSFPHNNQKQPVNQKVNESIRPRKVLRRWGGLECCCFSRLQKFHSCWGEFSHWQLTLNQPWIPLWWDPPDIPSFPQPGKPHHYMVCDWNLSHEAEIKRLQGLLYRISASQSQRCKIKQVHIQAIFSVGTFNLLAAPMRICCLVWLPIHSHRVYWTSWSYMASNASKTRKSSPAQVTFAEAALHATNHSFFWRLDGMQSSLYICIFEKSNPFTVSDRLSRFHAVTGSLRCCFMVSPPSNSACHAVSSGGLRDLCLQSTLCPI